jgi:hypothetical protein
MPEWIKKESSLWPSIRKRLSSPEWDALSGKADRAAKRNFHLRWQWALAGLFIVLLAGTTFIFHNRTMPPTAKTDVSSLPKTAPIKITHAKIHGKRAMSFIYPTEENIFIWFDELNQEED